MYFVNVDYFQKISIRSSRLLRTLSNVEWSYFTLRRISFRPGSLSDVNSYSLYAIEYAGWSYCCIRKGYKMLFLLVCLEEKQPATGFRRQRPLGGELSPSPLSNSVIYLFSFTSVICPLQRSLIVSIQASFPPFYAIFYVTGLLL